ncbi:MAG: hypothetical protein K8R59_02960 [Thermoanaerobaculales bacterium]|nr:hypothetical protein [Thermoanaerobaculales bacterium]
MVIDRAHTNLKQLGHRLLAEPNRPVFKAALDAGSTVLGRRKRGKEEPLTPRRLGVRDDGGLTDSERRARRRAWARLIRRVYEVDPLACSNCGGEMRIVSVILEHRVITRILGHLARKGIEPGRGPPEGSSYPLPRTA